MCPFYAEMDVIFGHKPNFTPIESYSSQEKDSLNGDDDDNVLLDKDNDVLESPLNLVPLLHDEDDLVQAENLQYESVTRETSENACLEWDRERWNEEKARNMEKKWFKEVKLQKQIEFYAKKHTQNELEFKEKQRHMDLTIAALSSSRPIAELGRILTLIKKNNM
ncbi:hypothetical protein O181_124401 [Austropuccinia psidii MF-1]|uniref:Uncharacterized protein n=1 Tax=Austropuccinia psidii MF-1 TaxID=1389203 RepID=A0A9Q3KQD8_9BASI|nr:hypothetical protein [Austropuccinia psidii MF-1]